MAQVDYFLKIDGIDGESTDDKHRGEIEIASFSWGLSRPTTVGPTGLSAGRPSVQDFHFVTRTGRHSPMLLVACATGEHFNKAVLTVRKSGAEQAEYLSVAMDDVTTTSYQLGGTDAGDDGAPMDQFSLNFSKVVLSVRPQSADGSLGAPVTGGYDVVNARKI